MFHVEHSKQTTLRVKDFLVSHEEFSLVLDEQLDMLVTTPQPENLSSYYESEDYISHTDEEKGLMNFLYQKVKHYSLKKKLRLISNLQKEKGRLLDIGAGTGSFLAAAKQQDWITFGVEPNENARKLSLEKNVKLVDKLAAFEGEKFEVITLWHVLEHLPNLENTVKSIESLLSPNGVLVIAVPNYNSWDAKYYKTFWAAYDVPRHLWHFSQKSMTLLFSKKLQLTKTIPLIFDSFYVSLLSEKNKTGNTFSIKAIFVGFWSNLKAWSKKEYSSLIYCFRKDD